MNKNAKRILVTLLALLTLLCAMLLAACNATEKAYESTTQTTGELYISYPSIYSDEQQTLATSQP